MRIVFVASNFGESWATESHVAHELELLGHDVHKLHESTSLAVIEKYASESDAVFYMKSRGLPPDATALWERLERRGVPTASYHLDLYYGLARQQEIGVDPMWRTGTVFTADGDPATQAFCEARDVNHRWMPAAVVSDEVGRGTPDDRYRSDLCFVGKTVGYHYEWPWREEMIRHLKAMYGARCALWTHADRMWDRQLNDLFASVDVVVGDSLALPWHENYWSNRYYETIGRGGFLVAPWVPGIEAHFNEAYMFFYEVGSLKSMFEAIEQGLFASAALRELITGRGMEHVAARHTYRHRVVAMLEQMGAT